MLGRSWSCRLSVNRFIHIVCPAKSAVDESIAISIEGLIPGQCVTVVADATRHGVTLSSFANFKASRNDISLTQDQSLGGSYIGIDPMGLFTRMDMSSEMKIIFKMVSGKVDHWPYRLRVFDGHVNKYEDLKKLQPLGERTIHRMFLCGGVRRFEVRFKTLRGYLFMPINNSSGYLPAVIDIFGGAWGLVAHRASLLARHGYAVLAVAYAAFDDLPKQLDRFDMGYFAQAYEFLRYYVPEVDGHRVGTMGSCLGGTLALALAREVPDIKAVAVVSPEPIAGQWSYYFPSTRETVEGCKWYSEKVEVDGESYVQINQNTSLIRTGQAWRNFSLEYGRIAKAPVLLFYGSDDQLFDLKFTIPTIRQQFAERNKTNYELVLYKGAGHIIQPSYLPMFNRYYSPLFSSLVRYGGKQPYHALAQADMWQRCLSFFKDNLQRRCKGFRCNNAGKIVESGDNYRVIDFDKL